MNKPNIMYKSKNNNNQYNNYNKNIKSLSKGGSTTYIKKKSKYLNSCEKLETNKNNNFNSNIIEENIQNKQKQSFSTNMCYNSQRIINNTYIENDNLKYIKDNINEGKKIYENNNEEIKVILMPEYKYKLEKLRTRVINLLEIYSLFAIKSININGNNNKNSK